MPVPGIERSSSGPARYPRRSWNPPGKGTDVTGQEHDPGEQIPAPRDEAEEYRSASSLIIEGATAFGVAAGGLGGLGVAAAKVKQTFASQQSPEPQQPSSDKPTGEHGRD